MMNRKRLLSLALLGGMSFSAFAQGPLKYPQTRKMDVKENYHGTEVLDPYRWLENDTTQEVAQWVKTENDVTQGYLAQIPYRQKLKDRLTEVWNYERYSAPFRKGKRWFHFKNNGLQNQSVLYMQESPAAEAQVLLDPNKLSTDGTVALGGQSFSKDGRYMAYSINRSGSDWQEIYVIDVNTKKRTTDSLRWVKFSGMAWKGDGFYYSRFDEPKGASALSAQNENQKVFFHKIGTPQSQDVLVYQDPSRPKIGFGGETTKDERFLLIYGTEGAATGNELHVQDLTDPSSKITKIWDGFANNFGVADNIEGKLLVLTDKGAPKYRLVLVDPKNPGEKNWKTVIAEKKDEVLQEVHFSGGKIFAVSMKDAAKRVYQYDMAGKLEREVQLPTIGSAAGFDGESDDKELYYSFTSFTYPSTIFKYDIATGKSSVYKKPNVNGFDPLEYETKQIFYTSKDGKKVPMFLVYKKGLQLDGTNSTYLYGYGGFNISLNPSFSASRIAFLEKGGVFALANLRGGGEYGEEWHKGGMLLNKQNVFNDFIAAAEYLIKQKYTASHKLAIAGGSNGGLLVGACMTQRPDLFKVALPAVGVLDMLRYHKFTIGHAWVPEYGSSENPEQFQYIYKYSPLHNLKPGTQYPSTMVTTADHDDRVVPAHSFKFAAALQEAHKGENPVLIRIDSKAGHGAGKPTTKQIEEWADIWSFVLWNTGAKM